MDERRFLIAPSTLTGLFSVASVAGYLACHAAGRGGFGLALALAVTVIIQGAIVQAMEDRYARPSSRPGPQPEPPAPPRP